MQRSLLIGFLVCSLAACDDGGGDGGESSGTDGSTSTDPSSTTDDPTSDPTTESTTDETTTGEPGSSSGGGSSSGEPGTGSSSSGADGSSSSGGGIFTVTSPDFTADDLLPFDAHICEGNVHPALEWTSPPAGTMSFGVFFHDESIGFEHSAIWDISADASGVPAGIEAVAMPPSVPGASQCSHWNNGTGYGGPGSCDNTYVFTVYALDVATLEEVTPQSTRFQVLDALEAHTIETASIAGQTRGAVCIPNCTPVPE